MVLHAELEHLNSGLKLELGYRKYREQVASEMGWSLARSGRKSATENA